MTTQVLRGKIEPLALIDVLAYLGRNDASGALKVTQETVEKSIIINEGTIIFARSNQAQDRLGDVLLAKGYINNVQYEKAAAMIRHQGMRHGRALVEIGAISPKQLWETVQEQVRHIASSIIPWSSGQFEFFKQEIKQKESITLKWPIMDMIQDVIRNLDNAALFRTRFNDKSEVLAICKTKKDFIKLEPYEEHILHFLDGQTSISEICERSDYGELESLRVLYLLKSLGWVDVVKSAPQEAVEAHPMVAYFNKIYAYMHAYLFERVGQVGSDLLRKYYEDTIHEHPLVFDGVTLEENCTLNINQIQHNLKKLDLDDAETVVTLDNALNEYLNVGMLAITKLLGSEHEAAVISKLPEFD